MMKRNINYGLKVLWKNVQKRNHRAPYFYWNMLFFGFLSNNSNSFLWKTLNMHHHLLMEADGRPPWFWFWWRFLPVKREFFPPTVASCTLRTGEGIIEKFQCYRTGFWLFTMNRIVIISETPWKRLELIFVVMWRRIIKTELSVSACKSRLVQSFYCFVHAR